MNNGEREYIFTWTIENYSYCWHKIGEILISPEFIADGLEGTAWTIHLYPRGLSNKYIHNISLFLHRVNKDDGPKHIYLTCELSILASDESILCSKAHKSSFKMKDGWGYGKFIQMEGRRMIDYSPEDCFVVRCKIWRGEENIHPVTQIAARTRIGIEQISFVHVIEDFSTLEPNKKKTIQIRSFSKNAILLSSSLYFVDFNSFDGNIIVETAPENPNHVLSKCKLSLLDASGNQIECGEIDNRIDLPGEYMTNTTLLLTKQDILRRKSVYMPDDKLYLACECTYSTGVEFEKIERTIHGRIYPAINQTHDEDQNNIFAEKLSACPSMLDDLKTIYNKLHLTDIILQTKTNSFPAHKLVLCARSSVFNVLLTSDMKEKNTDCIQVDDIDDDILQQFLLYLYSDKVEKLNWHSSIKLYYVADKYKVEKLKSLCSAFLVRNLNAHNAIELQLLANTLNDCDLMRIVDDYTSINYE